MENVIKEQHINKEFLGGVITGQIAGLIMAVVAMIVFAVFLGRSPLDVPAIIGTSVLGSSALNENYWGGIVAGLLVHQLGPSLVWGALFGALASHYDIRTLGPSLALGLGIGIVSMVDVYLLVPAFYHAVWGTDYWNANVPMFWDWAAHLAYGASFAFYPVILRKLY